MQKNNFQQFSLLEDLAQQKNSDGETLLVLTTRFRSKSGVPCAQQNNAGKTPLNIFIKKAYDKGYNDGVAEAINQERLRQANRSSSNDNSILLTSYMF